MTASTNPSAKPNTIPNRKSALTMAISMALATPVISQAATFNVTQPFDNGSGSEAGSLSWAILQANTNPGPDLIELQTDVTLTGVMKRLIDSDVTLSSDGITRSISGNDQYRPLFVKSGAVTMQRIIVSNSRAEGGATGGGGSGAGLGGALFIYDGQVNLDQVTIQDSVSIGGNGGGIGYGGGGIFGDPNYGGGGGLFANATNSNGGYGGYGNYQNISSDFGQGSDYSYVGPALNAGFGGGGGGSYQGGGGHGGFGGGGGYSYLDSAGDGGFGGGGGPGGGAPGFGGVYRFGAGLGGGIFIRSGELDLNNVTFENNSTLRQTPAVEALGGALFVMHTSSNTNGNDQGMPAQLPNVTGCGVSFINNSAASSPGTSNNNNDFFDLADRIVPDNGVSLSDPCVIPEREIVLTGNGENITDGDNTPDTGDFTAMGNALIMGQPLSRTFEITNIGNTQLDLTGNPVVELQNNSGQFSITSQPFSTALNNGDMTSFEVTFTPVAEGPDSATVVIQNNDSDEAPFDFSVSAEGFLNTIPYFVTETTDNGTGLEENTLSWAILQANSNPGSDLIELQSDVTLTGVMKRLVDSDVTIASDGTHRTISGNNQHRPLFIRSGQVNINNLTLSNGRAQGGSSRLGGYGAGLGGSLFIYDGQVNLESVVISQSVAVGGSRDECLNAGIFCEGGGGMFGYGLNGGGGLFGSILTGNAGAYGGYGLYQNPDPMFGQGGQARNPSAGQNGGFGGGGGYGFYDAGGHGGFGGGGGHTYDYTCASYGGSYCTYYPGDGGFGAGGGKATSYTARNGTAGFGGYQHLAAGLGGGVFVRSGQVSFADVTISNNLAMSSNDSGQNSEGLGGGIFVMHTLSNPNGNQQGMPTTLPSVTGCGVSFFGNTSDTDSGSADNNDDLFDLAGNISGVGGGVITDPCPGSEQDILVSGNGTEITDGDTTPEIGDFTFLGSAQIMGQSVTQRFEITNVGVTDLNLTGIPIIELQNNNGQFSVTSQPQITQLSQGQTVGFDVTFTPSSEGTDTATVVIQNDDPDEAPYDFTIEAEGVAQAPVLQVLGNGTEIIFADNTPNPDDNTDFGYTPVANGMIEKTFELKNIGLAPLNLSDVQLFQFNNDFSITQNITDATLDTDESTFVTVRLDPENAGPSSFTAFEVYDDNFNFLHFHQITGYGQPSLIINSEVNYVQEGGTAEFTVSTDVPPTESLNFLWQVTGQVDSQDFPAGLPSGAGIVSDQSNDFSIQFQTRQDGVYEGPELFTVVLSTTDPRLALGFPSVSGGVIDDDLIFADGFNPASLNQVLSGMARYAIDGDNLPSCDVESCQFLNRSMDLSRDHVWNINDVIAWFEETLVMVQPNGDWDGDGLPNHHDLNPFGLSQKLKD